MVKTPSAMQETQIRSWAQEDPLKKKMATHSSILAWRIPCTEEPGIVQSIGLHRVGHDLSKKAKAAACMSSTIRLTIKFLQKPYFKETACVLMWEERWGQVGNGSKGLLWCLPSPPPHSTLTSSNWTDLP